MKQKILEYDIEEFISPIVINDKIENEIVNQHNYVINNNLIRNGILTPWKI
jgi:hypothetical protein